MTIDEEKLRDAVLRARSYRDVCRKIGAHVTGSSYRRVRNKILALGLDTTHFQPHVRRGHSAHKRFPLSEILVEDSTYANTSRLRKRLIKEGLLKEECDECQLGPTWNNKPLVLQLDHKNGISNDHRIENLRLLCPNCHSQTPTYKSKNIGRVSREITG